MFGIKDRGSTVGREVLGGVTTFMAMSYILFVQVGLLGSKGVGMDDGGVLMAMCISAGIACILMGIWANYPIALAPGMGENFIFVGFAGAMAGWSMGYLGWQMALALTALAGVIFLLLSTVGFRSRVLNAIPDSLKSGIAAGIGLFIAVIGFSYGNLVVKNPDGLVMFPGFSGNIEAWLTLIGLGITIALLAFRIRGAILIGILATTGIALLWGQTQWRAPVSMPGGLGETAGGLVPGFANLWSALPGHWIEIVTMIFILLFMDLFDTVGTLVGVAKRAGLMHNGKLPRAEKALAADAAGTVIGGCLGSSTVTSYIESVTGVQDGARTGLAAVITGLCLMAAMFFGPLVQMVMGEFGFGKYPMIAPALIIVGAMMLRAIRDINWDDVTEYIPAFLTMVTMPLAYSISAGIAIGFVSYAFGKLVTGRVKECPIIVYVFAVLFVIQYAFVMPKG
ncbi:MAG: NCS2 family permease [Planctomycetota bacterium]|nr:NCS2 family permease [Planctomycetota bacterium]